jgi:ABC-type polysaccharide/polyol phosphate export permease
MPKYLATLATIISNFVSFLISIVVLAITMIATQANVTWYILLAPLYLVLFFFFVCGIGLIMATITVFFRDIEHIYGVLITMLSFASAIFYPAEIIPENYRFVLTYNPLFHFIDGFRDLVYVGTMPSALNIIICFSITIISMVAGVFAFVKYQDKFILYL